jgi:hypothetical protein
MSEEHIQARRPNQGRKVASGALAGVSVVSIVQMLSVNSLDVPLKISVYSFAITIPALSAVFINTVVEDYYGGSRVRMPLLVIVTTIGYLAGLIGVAALFFHFAKYAGILFIVLSLLGIVAVGNHFNKLKTMAKTEPQKHEDRQKC